MTHNAYEKMVQGIRKDLESDGLTEDQEIYEIAKSLLQTNPELQNFLEKAGVTDVIGRLADDIC